MADRVLVSGGTGFLGKRTVLELLDRGYDVRTTVRDLASEDTIRTDLAAAGIAPGNRLEVVAANLTSDDGWPEAAADCRFVLHIASPFPPEQPKDPDELIVPAREGAKRALAAALDAGAERVVLTSSVAAIHANRQDSGGAAAQRGRLDRRRRHLADPLHAFEDAGGARRVGARRGEGRPRAPRDRQPGRHHRPRARRGALLLAADDRAAARG